MTFSCPDPLKSTRNFFPYKRRPAGLSSQPACEKAKLLVSVAPPAALASGFAVTAVAAAARAWWPIFLGTRNIYGQVPSLEFLIVKHFDGLVGFLRTGEFNKGKTARFACELVQHKVHRGDNTRLGKIFLEVVF